MGFLMAFQQLNYPSQLYFLFYLIAIAVKELPCFPPSLSATGGATEDDPEIVRRAAAWKVSTTDFSVVDNCDATDAIVVR